MNYYVLMNIVKKIVFLWVFDNFRVEFLRKSKSVSKLVYTFVSLNTSKMNNSIIILVILVIIGFR